MKPTCLALAAILVLALAGTATADGIPFSGGPGTGTPACDVLSSPGAEGYCWNYDDVTFILNDWGSPGVSNGVTPYAEAVTAYGMDISFTGGGTIDPSSVDIGNAYACGGGSTGGTTFCTIAPIDIWEAFQTDPDSIEFLAQDPSYFIVPGQYYFVNIFFDGALPTAFTGEWLTAFSPTPTPPPTTTPEAGTFGLFSVGLAGVLAIARKRRRRSA